MSSDPKKRRFEASPRFLRPVGGVGLAGPADKSFTEVREDLRLKQVLKRAVSRETAPGYLIESIRQAVNRG